MFFIFILLSSFIYSLSSSSFLPRVGEVFYLQDTDDHHPFHVSVMSPSPSPYDYHEYTWSQLFFQDDLNFHHSLPFLPPQEETYLFQSLKHPPAHIVWIHGLSSLCLIDMMKHLVYKLDSSHPHHNYMRNQALFSMIIGEKPSQFYKTRVPLKVSSVTSEDEYYGLLLVEKMTYKGPTYLSLVNRGAIDFDFTTRLYLFFDTALPLYMSGFLHGDIRRTNITMKDNRLLLIDSEYMLLKYQNPYFYQMMALEILLFLLMTNLDVDDSYTHLDRDVKSLSYSKSNSMSSAITTSPFKRISFKQFLQKRVGIPATTPNIFFFFRHHYDASSIRAIARSYNELYSDLKISYEEFALFSYLIGYIYSNPQDDPNGHKILSYIHFFKNTLPQYKGLFPQPPYANAIQHRQILHYYNISPLAHSSAPHRPFRKLHLEKLSQSSLFLKSA